MQTFSPGSEVGAMALAEDGTLYVLSGTRLWSYDGAWHETTTFGASWHHTMAIDDAGQVWLAGENRITRWDGSDAIEVDWGAEPRSDRDADPPGPESWVQVLASGVDSDMWAVTGRWDPFAGPEEETALIHFEADGFTRIDVPADAFTWAAAIEVAPDGSVWIATGDRLLRYDGAWRYYSMDDQPPLTSGRSLAIGPAGEVWAAANDGILRNEGGEWRRFGPGDFAGLADRAEGDYWVASGADGSIWGGLGCNAFHLVSDEWLPLPAVPNAPEYCYSVTTTVDAAGSLWMSPSFSAVYRWLGDEWQRLAGIYSLNDFAVGDDGEVWMVDHDGINRVVDGDRVPVLAGVPVSEIVTSDAGEVWAAGGRWDEEVDGLWHFDGAVWSLTRRGSTIHSLTRGPNGGAWGLVIRSDGGTNLIDLAIGNTRFVAESTLDGGLAIAPDGTVWLGGEGRLYRVDPL
ncbi:MAG: hypothetical protein HKN80_10305 [Acidimicrobiia bacterium]|nr:hypothetical protein [Acidimicrobiia bacterium]